MDLMSQVAQAFSAGAGLSQALDAFVPRAAQTDMAQAVARTVTDGGILAVEAGTGVGKTFAYLVPALLSGERVLLSTATKALQDQLFARDLPRLLRALAVPVHLALLKGRASYLCTHRLSLARQAGVAADTDIAHIEEWAHTTRTGDLAELPGLDERSPWVPLVTSTRDNCLGSHCPLLRDCHVNLARREAMLADLVVVNHHLVFADLAVRESGVAELLPSVRVLIFDEAHQLNDIGVQFMGASLGSVQLLDLARDLLVCGLQQARGLVDWNAVVSDLEQATRDLRLCLPKAREGARLAWSGPAPDGVQPQDWQDAMANLHMACSYAGFQLATVTDIGPDFVRLRERCDAQAALVSRLMQPAPAEVVRWVEAGGRSASALRLIESPLSIAQNFKGHTGAMPAGQEAQEGAPAQAPSGERPKAWIFTSATLGSDEKLSWFTESCGLAGATTLRLQSPFDYARQAALYIPSDLPRPSDPAHSQELAALVGRAVQVLGGRTLVLTTTLKALKSIGEALQAQFPGGSAVEVLVQGEWPKRHLMERFRLQGGSGYQGCVLVASATFWEGFDVPGEALQLVVIDKLPFPPPNDPLVAARSKSLEAAGRSPFNAYFIPEAIVALKQGAGRLIRHETDRGVLLLGDTRLAAMGYGKRVLRALPPMRRLDGEDALLDELAALKAAGLPELPPRIGAGLAAL